MTPRTRRRFTLFLAIGLLTLPAEALLFPVALTPDPRVAAVEWADALPAAELHAAAAQIDHYPPVYRRAIMGELDAVNRSKVWRHQFSQYLASHPGLTPEQASIVRDAIEVSSADAFTLPINPAVRERIGVVFNRAVAAFGPGDASALFVTLGPAHVRVSALPLTQRLADRVRTWRVGVVSAEYPDCNCNVEIDTCDLVPDPWLQCSELYTCKFDQSWPMCGPLWAWACTGWCKIIRWPANTQ
jgi:hypothetical protein